MPSPSTPGVYLAYATRVPEPAFSTGVPAFLGFRAGALDPVEKAAWAALRQRETSRILRVDASLWPTLAEAPLLASPSVSYLGAAVRGFFENGGRQCYLVIPAEGGFDDLEGGLEELESTPGFDLICAPDFARLDDQGMANAQKRLLEFCNDQDGCFAILDAVRCTGILPDADIVRLEQQRAALAAAPGAENGALYVPWLKVQGAGNVPPCGHIAGIYTRTDLHTGVHKAPANEALRDVIDLEIRLSTTQQEILNPQGINCVRVFPGRGIRVWGARTLSEDAAWTYVNVRRLVLTVKRWLDQAMAAVVFEPNDLKLWVRVHREVSAFLLDLFQKGALRGKSPDQAFFVKCNAETNPPEVRAAGQVVTEVGLAVQVPSEFVVTRVVFGAKEASAPIGP